jgi:hypothetical protein
MTERDQDPGPDDVDVDADDREAEGPQEIVDAAFDELGNPADESDVG